MRRYFKASKRHPLIETAAFQLTWFLCLYSKGFGTLCVLTVYLLFAAPQFPHIMRGLLFVTLATGIGCAIDSLYTANGWLQFPSVTQGISFNLMALWVCFSCTLLTLFSWLHRRWWLASLLGAVFGPLSYYAGMQLGSVAFPRGLLPTLALYSESWALLFPMLIWISQHRIFTVEVASNASPTP